MWSLITFWIIYLVRMVYDLSIVNITTYNNYSPSYFYMFGLGGCFIPAIAVYLVADKIDYTALFKSFYFFSLFPAILLVYSINEEFGINMKLFAIRMVLGRTDEGTSVFNPIIISQVGISLSLISFYLLLFCNFNKLYTLLFYITLFGGFLLAVLGASKGPVLNLFILIFLMLLHHFLIKKKNIIYVLKFSIFFILSTLIVFYLYSKVDFKEFHFVSRIETGAKRISTGKEERNIVWKSALNQFYTNPIAGDSFLEKTTNQYPHNILVEVLMATGIIGGIFFLSMLICLLKKMYIFMLYKSSMSIIVFFFISNFIYALLSGALFDLPAFWVLASILLKNNSIRADLKTR